MLPEDVVATLQTLTIVVAVGAVVALLAYSRRHRADPRWGRVFAGMRFGLLIALMLALAFVAIVSQGEPF